MASRMRRNEWVRGLPRVDRGGKWRWTQVHSASERSLGYIVLIPNSVRRHVTYRLCQTRSETLGCTCTMRDSGCTTPILSWLNGRTKAHCLPKVSGRYPSVSQNEHFER